MPRRVLGIDPGLRLTGYAVLELPPTHASPVADPTLVEAGVIRLKARRADAPDPDHALADRLVQLADDLNALLDEYTPDCVALEQLFASYAHPRTAVLMAHARGVIVLAAGQRGLPVQDLQATEVKRAVTGHGHATKQQIAAAVTHAFRLSEPPSPPDVADAMAIALTHARRLTLDRATQRI